MPLGEVQLLVHWKHFLDGYPICWNLEQMGVFEGTRIESEVTCPSCIKFLKESE